jgi:heat shock protein HslJ
MYGEESLISGTAMTAEFDAGEIRGSASCNQYFGSYTVSGDQITLEGLGWTEMACMDPEGIMEQEIDIMTMLSKATSFRIESGNLYIEVESGAEMFFLPRGN